MNPHTSAARLSPRPAERWLRLASLAVAAGVVWFYLWTVQSASADLKLRGQKGDYYNLLVDGFEEGHLYMRADPDPRLLALPPGERPGGAPFLLDASLYQGRYYLYFGVTPVVTAMLPYAVLTGQDMPEALAAVIFMVAGFGLATAWWWEVRREFFPRLGGGWFLLGVVALGFCTAAPSALRRPLFYEVAIGAGYAFSMMALWAVTRAWRRPAQRAWWLVLAGVAVGLAVGARANLAPAGILLLIGAAVWVGRGVASRATLVALLAAGGGAGAVGAGLASYNYARFGSVAEFGHHHQLGSNPQQMFRVENLGYNLKLYYFTPPVLNGYFPFMSPGDEPGKPADYVGREHVHGQWPWTVLAGIALVTGLVVSGLKRDEDCKAWVGVCLLPGLLFFINLIVVALTGVRSNRYMLDFQPALVLATLVILAAGLVRRGWWTWLLGCMVAFLVPAAVIYNVLGSMQVHGFLRATAPRTYAAIASRADRWVWPWLTGEAALVGDREVELRWPTGNRGRQREPLLTTGTQDFRDALLIDFDGKGKARMVYEHGEYGEVAGEWFVYTGGVPAKAIVAGALLLPGVTHPWYQNRDEEERMALKRRLRVIIDGVVRLDRDVASYDSSPRLQRWGTRRQLDGKDTFFTGVIARVAERPIDLIWLRKRAESAGAVRLWLDLPQDRYNWVEPLVQTGGAKGFDALCVHYVRPGFVRLMHDHLGSGAQWSEEFAVDYGQRQQVEVSLAAANDAGIWASVNAAESVLRLDQLRVRWNGRDVFRANVPVSAAKPLAVTLGLNYWNASGVRVFFAGQLTERPRLEPLGVLSSGELVCRSTTDDMWKDDRGIWLRCERSDGKVAALIWQCEPMADRVKVGWVDGEHVEWLVTLSPNQVVGLVARLGVSGEGAAGESVPTWLQIETSGRAVYARKTDFFAGGSVKALALQPQDWTGSALGVGSKEPKPPADELPGRVRLRFVLPSGGFKGGSPLLSAGRTGAADSVYLRGLDDGRYVVGLDHWGVGGVESEPFTLGTDTVHALMIEMGSLDGPGRLPANHVRFAVDGKVVLDRAQTLYSVEPSEIFYGKNPLGMSTSEAIFRGEIVSVRKRVDANER